MAMEQDRDLVEWVIEPGDVVTRSVVAERYGGGTQGGIQPSRRTPNVMLYSDPAAGEGHGYSFDGAAEGAFFYTGEGQVGDQRISGGNLAITSHVEQGRTLRVFEVAGGKQVGGKPQRYLGAYKVDPSAPYRFEAAPDRLGAQRKVVVFRLIPDGPTIDSASDVEVTRPTVHGGAEIIPVEVNIQGRFNVAGAPAREGERWEAKLMGALEDYLTGLGHEVGRVRIRTDDGEEMVTDTYDVETGELFEVKPAATRAHVRAAVAQLLDYRRHVPGLRQATVLLPQTPSHDLQEFVAATGLRVAIFGEGELHRLG